MATTQIKLYGKLLQSMLAKEVSIQSGATNLYAMLCTSSYSVDQDTHRYKSDVTGEVANGNGYTTGGVQLTGVTVAYDAGTNKLAVTCNAPSWTGATFTAATVVIYDRTAGTDASRALVGYGVFDSPQSPSAGNLTINLTGGVLLQATTP